MTVTSTRLQFNVKGKCNLRQLTQLLFEFYRAGHLQKISQISLTPSGGGERIELQIAIERWRFAARKTNPGSQH